MSVRDNATLAQVPDALELAGRPGAAALFLAVDGLIRMNLVADGELMQLAESLAHAGLNKIREAQGIAGGVTP